MNEPLKPKPVPPPALDNGQKYLNEITGGEKPPLKSGQITFSDMTRRNLEAVGWKEGDPVPGDFGVELQRIQQEVARDKAQALQDTPLAADWKPPKIDFVQIEDLPPARQQEIGEILKAHKVAVEQEKEQQAQAAAVDARIPANVQGQQRELQREQILQGMAAKNQAAEQQEQPTESVFIDDRDAPTHNLEFTQTNCQRCHWPLSQGFDVEFDDHDKSVYLAAILGLKRFEKQYDLLGGNLKIIFRSLTTEESHTLQEQLSTMVREGRSIGDGEYLAHMLEFRLVLAVAKISVGSNVMYQEPPLKEWATNHKSTEEEQIEPTDIPRFRDYFYSKITQESMRKIIGKHHQEFQRLVEHFEVMTSDSDFWKGIELPA